MAAPLVLCYHAVSPDWPADLSVNPENFRSQLEHFVRRGYRGVTFAQVATGNNASKALAVTFDDGYRSVYDHAFPILEDLGLPGTVFVPAAHVGQSHPMSWPAQRRASASIPSAGGCASPSGAGISERRSR